MSGCTLISNSADEIVVRHRETGHEFVFAIDGSTIKLGPIREGGGAKDPGDVAADAHAFALHEAKRLGLVAATYP